MCARSEWASATPTMQRFARLHAQLDACAGDDGACLLALRDYFAGAAAADAAWAVHLLGGGRVPLRLPDALLRRVAMAMAGIGEWLLDECERAVGELAETIALLLPPAVSQGGELGLSVWTDERLAAWGGLEPAAQERVLCEALAALDGESRHLMLRLLRGGRLGADRALLQHALAEVAGVPPTVIAERLERQRGKKPSAARWQALVAPATDDALGQPYPFRMPRAWAGEVGALGPLADWQIERQLDGQRVQVVRRDGGVWVWTPGGELIGRRFPAIVAWAKRLPEGTVVDAHLVSALRLEAFDLLEADGCDLRTLSTAQRRERLEALVPPHGDVGTMSLLLDPADADALQALREQARALGHRGLVLRRRSDRYDEAGIAWWTWAAEPYTLTAVLVYAQAAGSAAGEYTFALWNRRPAGEVEVQAAIDAIERGAAPKPGALQLLPIAKIALPVDAAAVVDAALRETTLTRFGPVRVLRPTLVAEIAFDAALPSRRHKSGVVLRGARFVGWLHGSNLGAVESVNRARLALAVQA